MLLTATPVLKYRSIYDHQLLNLKASYSSDHIVSDAFLMNKCSAVTYETKYLFQILHDECQ